jgi:dynein heavy chain
MVYVDPEHLGWRPYVKAWIEKLSSILNSDGKEYVDFLFESFVDKGLEFVRKNCKENIPSVNINLVASLCKIMDTFFNKSIVITEVKQTLGMIFLFSFVWSIGGNILESFQDSFDTFVRDLFAGVEFFIPQENTVYGYFVDLKQNGLSLWDSVVPSFKFSKDIPYFQMIVPTSGTVKYTYLLNELVGCNSSVIFSGSSGVGKTVIAATCLSQKNSLTINFSAQTESNITQQIIETKLDKKRKNLLSGNDLVVFVDDLNMPKLDTYGSQSTIELLRQLIDSKGFYEREKLFWRSVEGITFVGACGPPVRFLINFRVEVEIN